MVCLGDTPAGAAIIPRLMSTCIDPAPRAVIFDMDGTLADTFPLVVAAWNAALSGHAGRQFAAAEVIARFGIPDPAMIRREIPAHLGDEAVEVYHLHYERRHAELARAFDGVTEMLAAIKARGLPTGVMTGKGKRSATITLAALGWDGCTGRRMFDAVVTGEDVARQKDCSSSRNSSTPTRATACSSATHRPTSARGRTRACARSWPAGTPSTSTSCARWGRTTGRRCRGTSRCSLAHARHKRKPPERRERKERQGKTQVLLGLPWRSLRALRSWRSN
jgi:phosphoglycolate phosphatase-like HAD superfamily hydrolase